uniref:Uncharacterized protein n=1 Tax=Equus caballus TaxID=9796 RepID=A0A9L0S0R4_HORSE
MKGIPEREEGRKEQSLFKEIIAESFPNLGKELDMQVHEAKKILITSTKRPSPKHTILKLSKVHDKGKILRAARQKKITYKGPFIRLSVDFSTQTLQARRKENDIFKILKDENFQTRLVYPVKTSLTYNGEIKAFPDKQNLREFITTRLALPDMIKGALIPNTKRQRFTKL